MSQLSLDKIYFNPWNFNRLTKEEEERLTQSIKKDGIQVKIVLRPYKDGYQVVGGEHRVKILKKLGWEGIPLEWVEFREMTDSEARKFIRSSNIRGRSKDLIKEAEHYFKEYEEAKKEGKTLTKLAEELGMDKAKLSRILSRLNFSPEVKEFISRSNLSAGVVDEFVNLKTPYLLDLLKLAEKERWTVATTREKLGKGLTLEGRPIKETRRRELRRKEIYNLTYLERGAIDLYLSSILDSLNKIRSFFKEKKVPSLTKVLEKSLKDLKKFREEIQGVTFVYNPSTKKREQIKNELAEWFSKGSREEREERIKKVKEKIEELRLS